MYLCNPYVTAHIKEFPVFKPNDYFWENHYHKDSGKEKWEVYAETIRKLLSKSFDFKISELAMEDKLKYKKILKGIDIKGKND